MALLQYLILNNERERSADSWQSRKIYISKSDVPRNLILHALFFRKPTYTEIAASELLQHWTSAQAFRSFTNSPWLRFSSYRVFERGLPRVETEERGSQQHHCIKIRVAYISGAAPRRPKWGGGFGATRFTFFRATEFHPQRLPMRARIPAASFRENSAPVAFSGV